jgi:crotonobetainyl-CoA:carnitine CoA-transferase CaiB-like acyl-CoA transferase
MTGSIAALAGLRVLDASESIAGQYCGRMLADYGAAVTLVEPPTGSRIRRVGPFDPSGDSLLFFHLNLGKASVTLDPVSRSGAALLVQLSRAADVVILGPGMQPVLLREGNPGLIVTSVSGFGESGVLAGWRGTEMIYQALSGMMNHNGEADREPLYGCGDRASYAAGVAAYVSTLAALLARRRNGRGQEVTAEVLETACAMSYPFQTQYIYNGSLEPRGDQRQPLGQIRMRDGWLIFWIYDDRWRDACHAFGAPGLADDPRFAHPKDRIDNWSEFTAAVERACGHESSEAVVARLQSVRVAASNAYRPSELHSRCKHLQERGYWQSIATPKGPRTVLGPQFRLSATPRRAPTAPPAPGQDNPAAYAALGLTRQECDALRQAGTI